MRTITNSLYERLFCQAKEADLQGLSSVAEALTSQIEKYTDRLRPNDAFYRYERQDFDKDLQKGIWNLLVRSADFYGVDNYDAASFSSLVEKLASDIKNEFCVRYGKSHGVGAWETPVIGETVSNLAISVEESDE